MGVAPSRSGIIIGAFGLLAGVATVSGCGGEQGSSGTAASSMAPGQDCAVCHEFTVAGTVFDSSGHGVGAITVSVGEVTLTSNAAGNFYTTSSLTFPASVHLAGVGVAKSMMSASPDGRCNRCHGVT